jgi:hypothetical protein
MKVTTIIFFIGKRRSCVGLRLLIALDVEGYIEVAVPS